MTNPNNAVGTPAAFSGRTSVKAFNNITNAFTTGIISGWGCSPVSGMTVAVGGSAGIRDIAVAEDASGNRTTISNISEAPVEITIGTAPTTYNRIDSIVLYVQPSPTGDNTTQDNPAACGIVAVKGTPAANAVAPADSAIRSAITTDGGSGTTAYYVVIANITVAVGATAITSGVISAGAISIVENEGSWIMARPTSSTSFNQSTADQIVPITTEQSSGRFSVLNNKIVIPDGVTSVRATAIFNVYVNSPSGEQDLNFKIYLNHGGTKALCCRMNWMDDISQRVRFDIAMPNIIIGVQPGDEISFEIVRYAGTATSVEIRDTSRFIVEQV